MLKYSLIGIGIIVILLAGYSLLPSTPFYGAPVFQTFQKSLIPETDDVFDLGTSTKRWHDLYLGYDCSGQTNGGALTTNSDGLVTCTADDGGAGGSGAPADWQKVSGNLNAITPTTTVGIVINHSSSSIVGLSLVRSTTTQATTTILDVTNQLKVETLTSALTLTGATGVFAEYAGTSCTDQVVTGISALGAATCTTLTSAYVDSSIITTASILDNLAQTNLADPGADHIVFWDDSDTHFDFLTTMTGLAISGNTLTVNDVSCTDCLNATEIEDIFLLNSGDVGTGVFDLGGADSFELPNGTGPTVDADGECAIDTTSGQLKCDVGSETDVFVGERFPAWSFSTTTSWLGTTTIYLGPAPLAQTWNTVRCDSSSFLGVSIYDGTNRMNYFIASSTIGTITLSSNNTFTAGEARRVDIGTSTAITGGATIACSAIYDIDAD